MNDLVSGKHLVLVDGSGFIFRAYKLFHIKSQMGHQQELFLVIAICSLNWLTSQKFDYSYCSNI